MRCWRYASKANGSAMDLAWGENAREGGRQGRNAAYKWQQEGGVMLKSDRAVPPPILSLIRCWLVGIKGKRLSYHIGLGR